MRKPAGIMVIAGVFLLYGIFFGYAVHRLYGVVAVQGYPLENYILHFIIAPLLSVGYIVGSVGLFRLREWARKLFLALLAVNTVYSVKGGFEGAFQNVAMQVQQKGLEPVSPFVVFLMALPVVAGFVVLFGGCIYYLTRSDVGRQFK